MNEKEYQNRYKKISKEWLKKQYGRPNEEKENLLYEKRRSYKCGRCRADGNLEQDPNYHCVAGGTLPKEIVNKLRDKGINI